MPVNIEVRDGNVGKSMMQLKRTLIREGLFKELKKRKFYIKPSVAKRLKREAAEKQRNKDLKRELRAAQKLSSTAQSSSTVVQSEGCKLLSLPKSVTF